MQAHTLINLVGILVNGVIGENEMMDVKLVKEDDRFVGYCNDREYTNNCESDFRVTSFILLVNESYVSKVSQNQQ